MNSIDMPSCRCRSRTRLSTVPWIETSRAEVISSAMITSGRPARARAIATRCRCPPDSWAGYWRARSVSSPTSSSSRATSARRSFTAPRGIVSAIVLPIVMRGSSDEYGSWKIICSGRGPRARRGSGWPSSRICPLVSGVSPTAARASVDLPEPDSPTSPTTAPSGTVRLTPSTAVRPRRAVAEAHHDVLEAQLTHAVSVTSIGSPACQQATRRPAPSDTSAGSSLRQWSSASGQRAA